MNTRKLLCGTALTTSLLIAGGLPAAANAIIPLGGYTGTVNLIFHNYESFLTKSGSVASTPKVGYQNFGIFTIQDIVNPKKPLSPLWTSNQTGKVLVGVFNDVNVTNLTTTAGGKEKTYNTGGVFKLYMVNTTQWDKAGGEQGTTGYGAAAGCTIGSLCYHGITDQSSSQLVLTMDLTPGISSSPNATSSTTLTATVDATNNPPSGSAAFLGLFSGTSQFAPKVSGKDSFCPNSDVTGTACPGADGSNFALASLDPITATAIPEPSSLVLFGSGLLGLGWFAGWRRKRKRGRVAV